MLNIFFRVWEKQTCTFIPILHVTDNLSMSIWRNFYLSSCHSAWCYVLTRSKTRNLFVTLVAYNIWSYLSIILLAIFFVVTVCYTCMLVSEPAFNLVVLCVCYIASFPLSPSVRTMVEGAESMRTLLLSTTDLILNKRLIRRLNLYFVAIISSSI